MSESDSKRSRHRCPQCGSRVKRVLRTANDKRRWDADDFRRYRCRSDTCSWQGLLLVAGHRRIRPEAAASVSVLGRAGRVALALLLAGGLAWGGMVALQFLIEP